MKKYILTALILFGLFVTPALALTPPYSLADQIANLRFQIADLTAQLNQLLAQQKQEGFCYEFNRNLKLGDKDNTESDIARLGRVLKLDDDALYMEFNKTMFETVKEFQSKNGIPNTGYVGPLTRAKLNELYGCNKKVFITPESLPVGKVGERYGNYASPSIIVHGLTGTSSWSVISGSLPPGLKLEKNSLVGIPENPAPPTEIYQAFIWGTPTASGTYSFTVQATDGQQTATQRYTLVVKGKETATSTITVLSPNGGETWKAKTNQVITWYGTGKKVDLYLSPAYSNDGCVNYGTLTGCSISGFPFYVLDKNISSLRPSSYGWIVATDINDQAIPAGQYYVRICEAGSKTNCDSSDNYFTITAN